MGNNTNPRIVFRCDYCGEWSTDRPSHYKLKIRHFCSQSCYSAYRKEILPITEQHAYKGGGMPQKEKVKRLKARSDLNHAVKQKRIYKKPCEKCGNPQAQAHHHDYNKPLEVQWLCLKCHWAEHKQVHENPELLEGK